MAFGRSFEIQQKLISEREIISPSLILCFSRPSDNFRVAFTVADDSLPRNPGLEL